MLIGDSLRGEFAPFAPQKYVKVPPFQGEREGEGEKERLTRHTSRTRYGETMRGERKREGRRELAKPHTLQEQLRRDWIWKYNKLTITHIGVFTIYHCWHQLSDTSY